MFELIFLGTSASAPSIHRGLPSMVVIHDEYRFLVDCGEGTQRQILQSGLGFKRLNRVLITHGHLDHILGLAGLLSTYSRWEMMEELEIFGGLAALDRIRDLLFGVVLRGAKPPMAIKMYEVTPGPVLDGGDFIITAHPVWHRSPDSYAYIFQEKTRRPFLPDKAEELGVPPGPLRRDLVNGFPATLPNGRKVQPDEVLGPERPGTRLVLVGDVGRTEDLVEVCKDADALIIESTYLDEEAEMAHEFAHLTAKEAATLAVQAGVRQLILTHISRRYRERDVVAEAQSICPNTIVARDFDKFQIKRGSPVVRSLARED